MRHAVMLAKTLIQYGVPATKISAMDLGKGDVTDLTKDLAKEMGKEFLQRLIEAFEKPIKVRVRRCERVQSRWRNRRCLQSAVDIRGPLREAVLLNAGSKLKQEYRQGIRERRKVGIGSNHCVLALTYRSWALVVDALKCYHTNGAPNIRLLHTLPKGQDHVACISGNLTAMSPLCVIYRTQGKDGYCSCARSGISIRIKSLAQFDDG